MKKRCGGAGIESQAEQQRVKNAAKTPDENRSHASTVLNSNVLVRFPFVS